VSFLVLDYIVKGKYYEIINNLCTGWEVFKKAGKEQTLGTLRNTRMKSVLVPSFWFAS
jgi:hypothetical protein